MYKYIIFFFFSYFCYADNWSIPTRYRTLPKTVRTNKSSSNDYIIPFLLAKIKLEDVNYDVKRGRTPDATVKFSPDGRLIAIGTAHGNIIVFDIYNQKILWQKNIAEGMVKQIDFSPNGKIIYVGEQSVDAYLYSMDTLSGKINWTYGFFLDIDSSPPPSKDDIYGVYRLPGCYKIKVLENGNILALGIHSWGSNKSLNNIKKKSCVYCFSPNGNLLWKYPHSKALPLTISYFDSDSKGNTVALLIGDAASNTPKELIKKESSLVILCGNNGREKWSYKFSPLKPYFKSVSFWQSVSVNQKGSVASIGFADGRTMLFDLINLKRSKVMNFGAPILIGGIPVSARATYTKIAPNDIVYFQTASSSVPFAGDMQFKSTPPGPHPNANTINAVDLNGNILWRFRSKHEYQNFWTSQDGRWMITSVNKGDQPSNHESGVMLFDTKRKGGGTRKLVNFYRVEGRAFFQADISRDGSAYAVIEIPYKDYKSEKVIGTYQVHVLR